MDNQEKSYSEDYILNIRHLELDIKYLELVKIEGEYKFKLSKLNHELVLSSFKSKKLLSIETRNKKVTPNKFLNDEEISIAKKIYIRKFIMLVCLIFFVINTVFFVFIRIEHRYTKEQAEYLEKQIHSEK